MMSTATSATATGATTTTTNTTTATTTTTVAAATTTTSTTSSSSTKRKRTIRKPYHISAAEHIENRCLQQAIQNSKVDQIRLSHENCVPIPIGPIFYPTYNEFNLNPIQYIEQYVRPIAELYGICKIVPPKGWNPKPFFSIPIIPQTTTTTTTSSNVATTAKSPSTTTKSPSTTAKSPPPPPSSSSTIGKTEATAISISSSSSSSSPSATSSSSSSVSSTTAEPLGTNDNIIKNTNKNDHDNIIVIDDDDDEDTNDNEDVDIPTKTTSTTIEFTTTNKNDNTTNTSTTTTTSNVSNVSNIQTNSNSNSSLHSLLKPFETKYQLLHRLQEGLDFQDGTKYNCQEYIQMAYLQTLEYKNIYYNTNNQQNQYSNNSNHQVITPSSSPSKDMDILPVLLDPNEGIDTGSTNTNDITTSTTPNHHQQQQPRLYNTDNLEQDYWDIVEMATSTKMVVEYGNDVDTHIYGSGFPLSYPNNQKSIYTTTSSKQPSPMKTHTIKQEQGHENVEQNNENDYDDDDTTTNIEQRLKELFLTEDYYRNTLWNLNNIPCAPDSVLRHVKVAMNGINVPWMYYGSLFTTFCWHNEDNYLYSINYHHMGSPKQWYGVPGIPKDAADGLEKVFKSYLAMKMRDVPDLLHHITTMFSPRLLQNVNVPVYKMIQYEGEFIITFPRAFHCGFSYGPNIGEAVNFGSYDWIPYGADANEKYRSYQRPAVFSHERLIFTMCNHCEQDVTSYKTCTILYTELQRIISEELILRQKLLNQHVRDVSHLIHLRENQCDQLDEESANYDDQRTCHYCKHICFLTAVACQCSQSKVSCLRHSHFMCTCPNTSKYLMIWSTKDELLSILERVKKHCDYLQQQQHEQAEQEPKQNDTAGCDAIPTTTDKSSYKTVVSTTIANNSSNNNKKQKAEMIVLPDIAPGVQEDYERHKNDPILTNPNTWLNR